MFNVGTKLIDALVSQIETLFDESTIKFLGIIPKATREKRIIFTTARSSLTSVFLQALGDRQPNESEEAVLKQNLRIAKGYIDALKLRTISRVSHSVKAVIDDALNTKKKIKIVKINKIKQAYQNELDAAKKHLKMILVTETNKMANSATAMQIMKVAESNGIDDPTVFFVTSGDSKVCSECKRLHLLSDLITPRVWKLSEVGSGYHKKGENSPKISGLHVQCRCSLTLLMPNFGFTNGKLSFKGLDWDEFKEQRKNDVLKKSNPMDFYPKGIDSQIY